MPKMPKIVVRLLRFILRKYPCFTISVDLENKQQKVIWVFDDSQ